MDWTERDYQREQLAYAEQAYRDEEVRQRRESEDAIESEDALEREAERDVIDAAASEMPCCWRCDDEGAVYECCRNRSALAHGRCCGDPVEYRCPDCG